MTHFDRILGVAGGGWKTGVGVLCALVAGALTGAMAAVQAAGISWTPPAELSGLVETLNQIASVLIPWGLAHKVVKNGSK